MACKVEVSLVDREKECKLACPELNQSVKFSNLGTKEIEETSRNRSHRKMRMHLKIEKRLIEEEKSRKIE